MIDRLTWLHVSDFHFTSGGDSFSQSVTCNALLEDVPVRAEELGPISFVLVSGDVAFSGQPAEYVQATEFMDELASRLSLAASNFFFVPGNHDVDRNLHAFAQIGAKQALSSQQVVDLALGDRARISDLAARQGAYRDFVERFTDGQERTETPDGLGYVAKLQVEPLTLAIIGLNSAWMCGSDAEEGTLIIGERQVIAALELVREIDPQLVLAMTHHPLECLTEWDQSSCRVRLLSTAHLLHRGHLHQADVTSAPHRKCLLVAAGSAHTSRFHPNSYNIVSVDLAAGTCAVHEYRYGLEERVFEPVTVIDAPCELGGQIPGSRADLAGALTSAAPDAAPYASYMAALLLGEKEEIPLRIDERIMFITAGMARNSDPQQAAPALDFLALRNLLRLRRAGVALSERVAEQSARVDAFAIWLRESADADDGCRARVSEASSEAHAPPTGVAHTATLLQELQAREDWELLEAQARRAAAASADPAVLRLPRSMLAQALMHSDEAKKREQAAALADQLARDSLATVEDYLLAAAAREVNGEPERSVTLTAEAIGRWPESTRLASYARGLSTRTGDRALRELIDTGTGVVPHG
jgi:3',5'-cyclic AMP phosphodiesterase CpdA